MHSMIVLITAIAVRSLISHSAWISRLEGDGETKMTQGEPLSVRVRQSEAKCQD